MLIVLGIYNFGAHTEVSHTAIWRKICRIFTWSLRNAACMKLSPRTSIFLVSEQNIYSNFDNLFEICFEQKKKLGKLFSLKYIWANHCFLIKDHIFWGGHKILRNLHLTFDWHYISRAKVRWRFCGLLRIYELY